MSPGCGKKVRRRLVISEMCILGLVLVGCQTNREPGTAQPVTDTCSWTAGGEGVHNNFGLAVGTAGDVDGDGYADVIIGGDRYKQFTGRAYVYAGGPGGLDAGPVFVATGETVNNHFGYAAGTAGDVNGDGYDDVIVGAYHHANFQGRAYLYTGSSEGLAGAPHTILSGEGPDHYFGRSVATAGDVNGDGYHDVMVGAQAYDRNSGRVYLYGGGPAGLNTGPLAVVAGEGPSSSLGQSVGTAGDVNGDGLDDIVAGAHGYKQGTGRIYVYAGDGRGLRADPVLVVTGHAPGERFGFAVGTAGDVNGDGFSEVIAGAHGARGDRGQVYVYSGGPAGPDARPAFTATGEVTGDWFGRAVGTAGDVNGDGYDDVIVGAPNHNGNTGRVYVFAGSAAGLQAVPFLVFDGTEANGWYGHAVGTAGDVNGDGRAEMIAGAYGYNEWTGRAYVLCGPAGD